MDSKKVLFTFQKLDINVPVKRIEICYIFGILKPAFVHFYLYLLLFHLTHWFDSIQLQRFVEIWTSTKRKSKNNSSTWVFLITKVCQILMYFPRTFHQAIKSYFGKMLDLKKIELKE